ncbi:MAG: 4a-hydroxytetrahydrobiopterin dehydratase [Ignavibacteriaceae bacterium]|nr:4a-hydroxytetrahydrobiopterin dehydratase [Ignavibacteriaceae bacterium]
MTLLSEDEIRLKLDELIGWFYSETQIVKDFKLKDFKEAMVFVNKVADIAELLNHHPDILLYGWNKVKISISTHSEGGITRRDFELAEKIESLI